MKDDSNPESQTYAWFIDETAIALYEDFEEAKKDLQNSPEMILIVHGDKESKIPKKDIYIAPL